MQFTSQEDIEAPIDKVFAALSDFETMERQAMRRGVKVRRHGAPAGVGTDPEASQRWTAGFKFRGREMEADIALLRILPPEALAFAGKAGGMETEMTIDLTALTPNRTRMNVQARLAPRTLSARLLVQSLKLAKARMTRKFSVRVAQFAKTIEGRARKAA
ncbi:Polyketide cyclase / dehydrase and lipid transport [Marinovum algicola DG 898]|nr:Polyketide cyclase / dehydrase and lipid transport [Marinovum algicola DG 898]